MFLKLLLTSILVCIVTCNDESTLRPRPFIFPVPLEFPNRNDRADQCWLRIEDVEVIETVTMFCHIAHTFLRSHIHDYNSRKMLEDDVDVSLWSEEPRGQVELTLPRTEPSRVQTVKDWRLTTVMDPTMHMRVYVSHSAVCRIVMYSREGTANYIVDCDKVLYFVNSHMSGSAKIYRAQVNLVVVFSILTLLY